LRKNESRERPETYKYMIATPYSRYITAAAIKIPAPKTPTSAIETFLYRDHNSEDTFTFSSPGYAWGKSSPHFEL
jgi:hypothetical protein